MSKKNKTELTPGEKLFNEIWRLIRENRTGPPETVSSNPAHQIDRNTAEYGGYTLVLEAIQSPYSNGSYRAWIEKDGKRIVCLLASGKAVSTGHDRVAGLLSEFGDTGFVP